MSDRPVVLFACIHNGGRSLAAKVLTEHHSGGRVDARSAGSEPGESLNAVVVQVLHDRGLTTAGEHPKLLTADGVAEADVVITMGCGDTCPVFPGKRYEDWELTDPAGQPIEVVRGVRDDIKTRVEALLAEISPSEGGAR